jgi:hypothetical protein
MESGVLHALMDEGLVHLSAFAHTEQNGKAEDGGHAYMHRAGFEAAIKMFHLIHNLN